MDNNIFATLLENENIMFTIFEYIGNTKEFMKFSIATNILNYIQKNSEFWLMILKSTCCKVDLDIVLLRLGYSVAVANNFSADKIDCFEVLKKLHVKRRCIRSGCLQIFQEINNQNGSCYYHSGRIKGQSLSCCRQKSFLDTGCKTSYHDGSFYDTVYSKREEHSDNTNRQLPQINKQVSSINHSEKTDMTELKLPRIIIEKQATKLI